MVEVPRLADLRFVVFAAAFSFGGVREVFTVDLREDFRRVDFATAREVAEERTRLRFTPVEDLAAFIIPQCGTSSSWTGRPPVGMNYGFASGQTQ